MPINEIAALPAPILALLQDEAEEAAKTAGSPADWLHGAIALRYADRAAAARRAEGKDTGTVRIEDDEVTVIADLPKKVEWDQEKLGQRWMALVGLHVAFDPGAEVGEGLASRHRVGQLLAGLLALEEVGGDRAPDWHREMVADGHRVRDLVGDEDNRQPTSLGLEHDAEHVARLLDAQRGGRFVEDRELVLRPTNWKLGRTAAWFIAQTTHGPGRVALFIGNHRYQCQDKSDASFRSYVREHASHLTLEDSRPTPRGSGGGAPHRLRPAG